jgi:hypothetical protein
MDGGRFAGVISFWSDDQGGWGHIEPSLPHLGFVVVYKEEMVKSGIRDPQVGTAVTYENGTSRGGISSAVAIERAPERKPR